MSTDAIDRISVNGGSVAAVEPRTNSSQRSHNPRRRRGEGAAEQTPTQPRRALQDTNKHNRGADAPLNTDKFGNRLYSRPRRPRTLANSPPEATGVLPTVAEEMPTELSQVLPHTKQAPQSQREEQRNGLAGKGTKVITEKVRASQRGVGAPNTSADDVHVLFAQSSTPSQPHTPHLNLNADQINARRKAGRPRQSTSDRWPSRKMIRKREGSFYVPPHLRHAMDRNATPPTSPEAQRTAAPGREVCVTLPSPPPDSGTREAQAPEGVLLSSSSWAFPQP